MAKNVQVVMTAATYNTTANEVVEVTPEQAKDLIENGHAREVEAKSAK